jgi:CheY-like chemotaxis protein
VGNAIKFTEKGEVFVQVAAESQTADEIVLHITVKDSGIGIAEEKMQLIFDAFTQADSSTTRRFGGTGLGLAICKELAAMMNGKVWAESNAGEGSTFHFSARLALAKEPVASRYLPAPIDISGRSVLVVDDNATNRFILEETLSSWKMKSTMACDGHDALMALAQARDASRPFSVVLLDADMPGMDGFTLASRIKENPDSAGTTIIMLSSSQLNNDVERCRKLGIAYLVKPVMPSTLMDSMVTSLSAFSEKSTRAKTSRPASFPDRKLRVLLAEDNVVNQAVAIGLLQELGHEVVIASNGKQAVAAFGKEPFDLVLMDVQMPEMDGFEATAQIRARQKAGGTTTPIVAMTAHAMKGDRERCIDAGMDEYLSKPVSAKDLLHALIVLNLTGNGSHAMEPVSAENNDLFLQAKLKAAVMENFEDGIDLLKSIAGLFIDHAPKWMGEIEQAIAQRDAKKLQASAHALKGSVSNFVQDGPYQCALELEQKARAGDLTGVEVIFVSLRREIHALCDALQELR